MKISFLGGGNMASALIGGLLKQGFSAQDIQVVESQKTNRIRLQNDFSVRTASTIDDQALDCDVLVLAVKPQQMREAILPLAGRLTKQLILSVAAGLQLKDISRWLNGHGRLVRAMSNTPAMIGQGMTGLYATPQVQADGREAAEKIMRAVGQHVWIEEESLMDVVTAISGSGPAYVFYFIEALQAAGAQQGLSAETARLLALQTVQGAAQLAAQSPENPTELRERVTSKGGTTEAALKSLSAENFLAIVARATQAATARGREMGENIGKDQ